MFLDPGDADPLYFSSLPRLPSLSSLSLFTVILADRLFLLLLKENLIEGLIFLGCLLDFLLSYDYLFTRRVLVKCCYILL